MREPGRRAVLEKALRTIDEMQRKIGRLAILGFGCRLPGGAETWRSLVEFLLAVIEHRRAPEERVGLVRTLEGTMNSQQRREAWLDRALEASSMEELGIASAGGE